MFFLKLDLGFDLIIFLESDGISFHMVMVISYRLADVISYVLCFVSGVRLSFRILFAHFRQIWAVPVIPGWLSFKRGIWQISRHLSCKVRSPFPLKTG